MGMFGALTFPLAFHCEHKAGLYTQQLSLRAGERSVVIKGS